MTVSVVLTIWGNIEPGALIVDADGTHWRVHQKAVDLPRIALAVAAADGRAAWATRLHDDEVALVDESASDAVDRIREHLDGIMLMERLPMTDSPASVALIKAHLLHHHHAPAGHSEKSARALREMHAIEHAAARPRGIPHRHVPVAQL